MPLINVRKFASISSIWKVLCGLTVEIGAGLGRGGQWGGNRINNNRIE